MVFNAVSSRVRWAFSAVAVLFISHPTPSEMDFILPVSDLNLQVDPWATLALSPGARCDVAKDTIVKSATHYKSRTNERHEKLLIVLQTPHAGTITYMVTDRGPDPDEMDARRNEHPSMSPSAGPSADLSLSSGDVWANDRIFIPGTRRFQSLERYKKHLGEQHDALCTITLNTPMSLAQLAVLLKAVYQHSVHYKLLTYQCYWHAYTVWEIMRQEFGGDVSQNKLQNKRGKYMGVNIRREDSVEAITDAYKNAWVAFGEEETRARQQAEYVISQAEERGRAEGEAQERARYEAERRELEAYRRMGPLKAQIPVCNSFHPWTGRGTSKQTLLHCSSATMLVHTPSFCSSNSMIFAIDFTSPAFHVTGAFNSPVPALHSQLIHIRHRPLYARVLLAFSALAPRYPSYTQPLYSHIVYSNSVQHHLHSNLL
ncbi:hypothetical protein PILCRDRAFT_825972 [Piloderma croceum F 1598]|uniref:Uncharacterized protein n=1 Tax=Piloderma croceum (strain F 1598) TaxID=765440 RepID=A0A0C3EW62_PILCF|nr:hypothetical protein PILCRDRAFT_825972 [Piloderma croceum F 1598]